MFLLYLLNLRVYNIHQVGENRLRAANATGYSPENAFDGY